MTTNRVIGVDASLESLKYRHNCNEGDIVFCEENKKHYVYTNGEWEKLEITSSGLTIPLYELNKNAVSQLPAYTEKQLESLEELINGWENDFRGIGIHYYMLLCNDIHYYTVFSYTDHSISEFNALGRGVIQVLKEGNYVIHAEEYSTDHFEIWVKKDDEIYDFLLFPYDQGVVTYG